MCCGSPLFLKRHYGVGYHMTVEKQDLSAYNAPAFTRALVQYVPEALLLTDVGTEVTFQLPFQSSDRFQSWFEYLDQHKQQLGVRSYGMSVTKLEEVFLNLAKSTAAAPKKTRYALTEITKKDDEVSVPASEKAIAKTQDVELGSAGDVLSWDRIPSEKTWVVFQQHMYAMLFKRYWLFRRDTKTWFYQFFSPVIFVVICLLIVVFLTFADPQPILPLKSTLYNPDIYDNHLPFPYAASNEFCLVDTGCSDIPEGTQERVMGSLADLPSPYQSYPAIPFDDAISIYNVSESLLYPSYSYEASVFGAVSVVSNETVSRTGPGQVTTMEYLVHANYSAVFGGPLFNTLIADAYVRTIDSSATVSANLFPFPLTEVERKRINNYQLSTAFLFLIIGLALIPAGFTMNVVRERETKAKAQQLLSGVSIEAYWLSTYLWYVLSSPLPLRVDSL